MESAAADNDACPHRQTAKPRRSKIAASASSSSFAEAGCRRWTSLGVPLRRRLGLD